MEGTTIEEAKLIFKKNFLGPEELLPFIRMFSDTFSWHAIPKIPWDKEMLEKLADRYILVLGLSEVNGTPLTIRTFRERFGINPEVSQPCFYNQDWYLNEEFIDLVLPCQWYLIRRTPFDNTRGLSPEILMETNIKFPPAILCTYTFFAYWLAGNMILWEYDFVWCKDKDHNGDRVYIGKYTDIDGINKSGFSIHRHLSLRPCYSAIDLIL